MMGAETRPFDFCNGRSVQPNNTWMLCGRISDTGLYSFCYRQIVTSSRVMIGQFAADVSLTIELSFCWFFVSRLKTARA